MQFLVPIRKRFVVPLAICQLVAKEQFFEELELFVYLKSICSGNLWINPKVINSAAHSLDCHPKTVKRRLARLHKRNWIGVCKSGVQILRSWQELFNVEGILPYRTGVVFEIKHFSKFKAFVVSACIGYLSKYQRIKRKWARQPEVKSSTTNHPDAPQSLFYPVACELISCALKVSISTASEWKQLGEEAGFLLVEKQFHHCPIDAVKEYKKGGYTDAKRIVFRRGKYYFQSIDLIAPILHFKTTNSIKQQSKNGQMPKHDNLVVGNLRHPDTPALFEKAMLKFNKK